MNFYPRSAGKSRSRQIETEIDRNTSDDLRPLSLSLVSEFDRRGKASRENFTSNATAVVIEFRPCEILFRHKDKKKGGEGGEEKKKERSVEFNAFSPPFLLVSPFRIGPIELNRLSAKLSYTRRIISLFKQKKLDPSLYRDGGPRRLIIGRF